MNRLLAISITVLVWGCTAGDNVRTTELGPNKCVAINGDDKASGDYPEQCWRTFQAAADAVRPGDRVCFQAGTYGGASIGRSGTVEGRIQWRRCPNVPAGAVLIRQKDDKVARVIQARGNVTDHTIDGLHWSRDLYGAGVDGLYMDGGNHRWHIRNMVFDGEPRPGAELWAETYKTGPNGRRNRARLYRIRGEDIILEDNVAEYWPFQIVGESDGTRRLIAQNNDFFYTGSHVFALASKCHGRFELTGNVYYRNRCGGSHTSDCIQINLDSTSGNPNYPDRKQGPLLEACRGGHRLVENVMVGSAENGPDMKGWLYGVLERNAIVVHASDSSGPPTGPNFSCGGGYVGRPQRGILARGNLEADNSNAHGNMRAGSAAYGNTAVHNHRSAIGVDKGKCGGTAFGSDYNGMAIMANNVTDSHDSGPAIDQGARMYADGNVYAQQTRWRLKNIGTWNTLEGWQKALRDRPQRFSGFDANAAVIDRADIFSVDTQHWTMGDKYPDTFDWRDIVARLDELRPAENLDTGGAPVAFVERDGFGREIFVGKYWVAFCCAFQQPSGWYDDKVLINGELRQLGRADGLPGVDPAGQRIYVTEPIEVRKGWPIDVVYPSGKTSRQRGAHEYWNGIRTEPEPPPVEPPPVEPPENTEEFRIPVKFSDHDAEEECASFEELGSTPCPVDIMSGFLDLVGNPGKSVWVEVGLRFDTLDIDDRTVDLYLELTPTRDRGGIADLEVTLERSEDCRAYNASPGNISERPRVDAVVEWQIDEWIVDEPARTPSLRPLFVELIEDREWKDGAAVCLYVRPSNADQDSPKVAYSFDRNPIQAAALIVERTVD